MDGQEATSDNIIELLQNPDEPGTSVTLFVKVCTNLYRDISLIRNTHPVGPYRSPMPRDLWWS